MQRAGLRELVSQAHTRRQEAAWGRWLWAVRAARAAALTWRLTVQRAGAWRARVEALARVRAWRFARSCAREWHAAAAALSAARRARRLRALRFKFRRWSAFVGLQRADGIMCPPPSAPPSD